jgi:hypothetical protein
MKRIGLISLLCLASLSAYLFSTDQQNKDALGVSFAFSDVSGTKLLSVETPADSASFINAIFQGGFILKTNFLGLQKQAPDWDGRHIARSFQKSPGALFQIQDGRAPARNDPLLGEGCLLVTEPFLRARELVTIEPDQSFRISKDLIRKIELMKGKTVAWQKSIAKIGANRQLILVQFDPEGKKCLADLVLVEPGFLSFDDYAANYDDGVKGFVWRVDVDGIDAASFRVLAAFKGKDGIEIALLWDGFEGQNLYVMKREGAVLRHIYESYRYWTPI